MKKIIINREQLRKLNESVEFTVDAESPTPQGIADALNKNKSELDNATSAAGGNADVVVTTPASKETAPEVRLDVPIGSNAAAEAQNIPSNVLANGSNVKVTGTGFGGVDNSTMYEHKKFSKRQLEEMRINNMYKNGKVYTKKQIKEGVEPCQVTREELKDFCEKNEFLFIMKNPLTGNYEVRSANTDGIVYSIINDIMSSPVFEESHDMDVLLRYKGFDYFIVIKLQDSDDKDTPLYVVYECDE